MKDPEWPVYYFRQHAEGKHCRHRTQTDVRSAADVSNRQPAAHLLFSSGGKRRFLMVFVMEERLTVHRVITRSGLVLKNSTSWFGTQPGNGKQNRKKSKAPEDSWRL